jgi:hypothetical protein
MHVRRFTVQIRNGDGVVSTFSWMPVGLDPASPMRFRLGRRSTPALGVSIWISVACGRSLAGPTEPIGMTGRFRVFRHFAARQENPMPLPTDEKLLELGDKIVATFSQIFGEHPGIRPAHGKGTVPDQRAPAPSCLATGMKHTACRLP